MIFWYISVTSFFAAYLVVFTSFLSNFFFTSFVIIYFFFIFLYFVNLCNNFLFSVLFFNLINFFLYYKNGKVKSLVFYFVKKRLFVVQNKRLKTQALAVPITIDLLINRLHTLNQIVIVTNWEQERTASKSRYLGKRVVFNFHIFNIIFVSLLCLIHNLRIFFRVDFLNKVFFYRRILKLSFV